MQGAVFIQINEFEVYFIIDLSTRFINFDKWSLVWDQKLHYIEGIVSGRFIFDQILADNLLFANS